MPGTETSSFQENDTENSKTLPDYLKCCVVFQDNSEHIYTVPTVKIQTYFLKELKEKHLTLFIPYSILRLCPKLKAGRKPLLTRKELTEFVEEAILVLKKELSGGYLTEQEYRHYVRLFRFAADRILRQHPQLWEEVHQMTEPLIKLTSAIEDELYAKITDQKAQLAEKDAEIQRLQEIINRLSSGNP